MDLTSDSLRKPRDQRDDKQDQEQEKQNLRHAGRGDGNSTEPEDRGDDSNDEEDQSPIQHLWAFSFPAAAGIGSNGFLEKVQIARQDWNSNGLRASGAFQRKKILVTPIFHVDFVRRIICDVNGFRAPERFSGRRSRSSP